MLYVYKYSTNCTTNVHTTIHQSIFSNSQGLKQSIQISGVSSWKKNSVLTDFFTGKKASPTKRPLSIYTKLFLSFKMRARFFSPNNTNYLYKHLYYVCKCQYLFRNFLMRYDAIVFQTFVSMIAYQLWLALIF